MMERDGDINKDCISGVQECADLWKEEMPLRKQ